MLEGSKIDVLPQMILKLNRKWSLNWTANDSQIVPQKIRLGPQMMLKLHRKWSTPANVPQITPQLSQDRKEPPGRKEWKCLDSEIRTAQIKIV